MKKERLILLLIAIFLLSLTDVSALVNETNAILINEFVAEPQTDWNTDGTINISDTWIELYNQGLTSINLTNWYLKSVKSNTTQSLSGIIHSDNFYVSPNPQSPQEISGRLELYDSSDNLIDAVTFGIHNDGNISDNAENGDSTAPYDECLARFPNGIDTDVDKNDFIKTTCTQNSENNISFAPVAITDLQVQPVCALETDDVTVSAEINGSIAEVKLSYYAQDEWAQVVIPGTSQKIYSYTINTPRLQAGTELVWQFSVLDTKNNMTYGELKFLPINSITSLLKFPAEPDGINGWYVSEPQFELLNPDADEITYRWNGEHFIYSSPFGLEGTPNNGSLTGGIHVLAYRSTYPDANCTESEREFVGKFDFTNPEIEDLYPEPESTTFNERPLTISAYIDETYQGNSGINFASVRMEINGLEVSAIINSSGILDAEVTYTANLTDGRYEVFLYAEDNSGRSSSKNWAFDLATPVEFDLEINLPQEGIYTDRRQQFNITLTREAEELLFINYNDPSPQFKRLCRNCGGFGHDRARFKSLREGENELTFQAIDFEGSLIEKSVSLTVDSKDPRIINSFPKSGVATGIFKVQFSEENPESLIINYGNAEVGFRNEQINLITECQRDRDYFCFKEINLLDYDGHEIEYFVTLSDIAGNTDESRTRILDVDLSEPIINSFGYQTDGKYATFTIEVEEPYLDEIVYIDHLDSDKEKILCNSLQDGICEKRVSLDEGNHDIVVIVRDEAGNEAEAYAIFFTDSKLPKIKRAEPTRGFASGEFIVTFEEVNPYELFLNYGSIFETRLAEINISNCVPEKKNILCSIEVNLSDFEEQEITYWFNLTDVIGNTDESTPTQLKVDTLPPKLNSFNYTITGKNVEFSIGINDPNFEEVMYKDEKESTPRFRTLCSRLTSGFCEKTKRFSAGNHVLDLVAIDEAGNEATIIEGLNFTI